ncbi:pirin-like [Paramacrobiotus metropolitanus]|uniref:pirin-like n=1 Tax=Paramacrobiotus metropolitanus TaxID=2943436 RepID=UPI002445DBDB|nr:pirin-like [Paramacrobiotus metropolitanus]
MLKARTVEKIVQAREQAEGEGARVRRGIGGGQLLQVDPFLLFDHAEVHPPAGFPDHPHRGFETVTYILNGSFKHEDFAGNKKILGTGDLQWMTAGRGVLHSETPYGNGGEGLQLWVNLPQNEKLVQPAYQDLKCKDIPVVSKDGVTAVIVAGEYDGQKSPVRTRTPTNYLYLTLAPGSRVLQPFPEKWNVFSYTVFGKLTVGPEDKQQETVEHSCIVYKPDGDCVRLANNSPEEVRCVLIAGQPLHEPVARHGPFVMNTYEEIDQAIKDFRNCTNGFEKAKNWKSEYMKKHAK